MIVGVVLLLISAGVIVGVKYKSNADAVTQAQAEVNSQQAITASIIQSMKIFNLISRAAVDAQSKQVEQSVHRVESIKKDISTDECANQLVPIDAANELLKHANEIR